MTRRSCSTRSVSWRDLTVVYDPDFPARRIPVDLNDVTLEQALDIVSMESKAFWKPVTENIIFVIPDQPQKRRDYEEQIVRTFYLSNTVLAQDLTEIVTGLRQLLDLKRMQQLNSQNAIIMRDTPDKLAIAEKMIKDIDKAQAGSRDSGAGAGGALGQDAQPGHYCRDRPRRFGVVPPGTTTTTNNNNRNESRTEPNSQRTNILTLQNLTHLNGSELQRDAAKLHGERVAERFDHQDHSESGNAIGGRPAGQAAYRRPRASGNRQLPGGRRRWLDGGHGIREPVGEHAISISWTSA